MALLASILGASASVAPLAPAWAEDEGPEALPGVGSEVERLLEAFSKDLSALYQDATVEGKERKQAERRLKTKTRDALLALVHAHRPGGGGPRRDLSEAYLALLSPSFVPGPAKMRGLVRELLSADPDTACAWGVVARLREAQVLGELLDPVTKAAELRVWASGITAEFPRASAAARAFDLLVARLELDTGNAPAAASAAKRLASRGAGGQDLLDAAEALAEEADRLPPGFAAPAFRLPREGDGTHVVLDRFAGRAVLVLFRVDDLAGPDLEHFARSLTSIVPSHELSVIVIPVGDEAEGTQEMEDPDATGWHLIAPGEENAVIAAAYRVGSRSALFLVGPAGKVLESARWDLPDAGERVRQHIRATVGAPLDQVLQLVQGSSGWQRFREVWRRLASGQRAVDSPDAVEQALAAGERAVYALMLAGAAGGRPVAYPYDKPPTTLHGQLVTSWCARDSLEGRQSWMDLTAPLLAPKGDRALATVDALYDLGIAAGDARARLEIATEKSRDWRIVSMALRTLANADTESRPEPLLRHARHKQWQVRLALAEALVGYRTARSVEALIALLGDKRLRVRAAAAVSLKDLTGYDFGVVQKDWAKWRRDKGTALQVLPRGGAAAQNAADQHRYAAGGWFGLKITSNRLVFVLDKSESMYYGLWDAAVEETELFLTTAGPTTSFAVVEFDAEPRVWKKKLAAANGRTVKGAVQ